MSDHDLQNYVDQKIASGQFGTAEEFATEAIRVYRKIESEYEHLRSDVQDRIAQADAGDVLPLDVDSIKRQLADELNADELNADGSVK